MFYNLFKYESNVNDSNLIDYGTLDKFIQTSNEITSFTFLSVVHVIKNEIIVVEIKLEKDKKILER